MTVSLSPCRKWPVIILRNRLQSSVFLSLSCIFFVAYCLVTVQPALVSHDINKGDKWRERLLRNFEDSPGSCFLTLYMYSSTQTVFHSYISLPTTSHGVYCSLLLNVSAIECGHLHGSEGFMYVYSIFYN